MRTPLVADLVESFGPDTGSLPDGEARGSTPTDLPSVFEALVNAGWSTEPGIESIRQALASGTADTVAVYPLPSVRVNFFPNWGYVGFDINLAEIVDQESVDAICAVMVVVGETTQRPVVIAHEGTSDAVLTYDPALGAFELTGG